jgi:hypothetical protein
MTLTVDGTNVYFPDGSYQNNGQFRSLDGNTSAQATSYNIGTYLLIDLQANFVSNNPIPLDSWSNAATGLNPAAPYYNGTLYPQAYRASNNPGNILSGTWVSRGSSLFQALVVRTA